MRPLSRPIRIGVSACLLGERVRYDGGHKRDRFLTDTLGRFFQWVPVCPEVEVGMGTPREPIHLVITDWDMPEMNGLELCRSIRSEDFDGYVFIIMLTGRDSGKQRIEGLHCGADAFLTKPLNPDELLVSLKTAERILALETRDLAMFALAKLSESRDPETGAHIEHASGADLFAAPRR